MKKALLFAEALKSNHTQLCHQQCVQLPIAVHATERELEEIWMGQSASHIEFVA
jgi:hypothetical protein